jgi:hypothetical protein
LKDQPLCYALVIFGLETSGEIALIRQEERTIDLEPVRSQALDTDDQMRTFRAGLEVIADAGLQVKPGIKRMTPARAFL